MRQGTYKIIGISPKVKEFCKFENIELGQVVTITKSDTPRNRCCFCGKIQAGYELDNGYSYTVGTGCIKHLELMSWGR